MLRINTGLGRMWNSDRRWWSNGRLRIGIYLNNSMCYQQPLTYVAGLTNTLSSLNIAKQILFYSNQKGKTQRGRKTERTGNLYWSAGAEKNIHRVDGWMARIVQFKTNKNNVQVNLNLLLPLSHQFDKSSQRWNERIHRERNINEQNGIIKQSTTINPFS